MLAGALGDELLDPQSERVERVGHDERELVATGTRALADRETEAGRRIVFRRRGAGMRGRQHRQAPADDLADVVAHQRRRHHAEE